MHNGRLRRPGGAGGAPPPALGPPPRGPPAAPGLGGPREPENVFGRSFCDHICSNFPRHFEVMDLTPNFGSVLFRS